MPELLIPLGFFTTIILIVYFTMKYNYQIKKEIIAKGGDIKFPDKKMRYLEFGLTMIGLSIGFAMSVFAVTSDLANEAKGLMVTACIIFFGGVGLLIGVFLRKRIEDQQSN
ncbi:DUF6249 domain-containing protein [Marinigracilibium pacificum]|uniref:DUF6249 domain-containing protein n=1 Tax=Marinigracilibium pacificum TaxID=2729599 RepID=A0A848IU83_9BACT|nr:DUF6249 domain-containing protein [Marinigracilibium pacificum]NMM47897.1 hypothetical protein [Marinigracilibium pacificum]